MAFNRRTFLRQGIHFTTLLAASTLSASALGATRLARVSGNPFYLGLASGDPRPDSVVIWTRLARETLGNTLSRNEPVAVDYEIAEVASFSTIYRKGSAAALPELGYSVHVDLQGLNPGENPLRNRDGVRARTLRNGDRDGRLELVGAGGSVEDVVGRIGRSVGDGRHVTEVDRPPVEGSENRVADLAGGMEKAAGLDEQDFSG